MPSFSGLLIVSAVAFGAPFVLGLFPRVRAPAVVLEIVAGIVVGPSVLGWVRVDATIAVVATLGSTLGQLVIAASSIADFGAIILLSIFFTGEGGTGATLLLIGSLLALAAGVVIAVRGAERSMRIRADLLRLQDTTAQIRVRGAMVLLVAFAAIAEALGLEAILGAFAAEASGAALPAVDRDPLRRGGRPAAGNVVAVHRDRHGDRARASGDRRRHERRADRGRAAFGRPVPGRRTGVAASCKPCVTPSRSRRLGLRQRTPSQEAPQMQVQLRSAAPLAVGFAMLFTGSALADGGGAVYTQTNAPTGNAVHRFDRGPDGSLTPVATYRTGGIGTGSALQSQGAIALSDDGRLLVAVDAGSNDIAAFRVGRRGHLTLVDREPSGGNTPVSVDIAGGSVYVLNRDGVANVTGFDLDGSGQLRARTTTSLTVGATGAAQVSVAPDGRDLVVTERGSNRLETLPLRFGRIGTPVVTASSGAVPFGFAFSPRGDLIVSEAGASTVSSYRLNGNGALRPITTALAVGQGAACWVVVTADGRFAYTGNASGSLSGFAIARDGGLTALTPGGLTAASPRPNDLAVAGSYLYAVNPAVGEVTAYRVGADGRLDALPGVANLGAGQLAGLAAR